jgi:hypothetical protein
MKLQAAESPLWTGRLRVAPGLKLEYKYLLERPDGSFTWEALAQNRVLVAPTSGTASSRDQVNWPG